MRILMIPMLIGLSTACSDVASEDLLTSGMYANLSVTADGGGTSRADAVLRAGDATSNVFVELTADDQLTASTGGDPVPMDAITLGAYHGYEATLPTDSPTDTYTISLTRTVDAGAPSSTMQLPEPFAVTAPATSFSRAADLALAWTPASADPMTITATGDCVNLYVTTVDPDAGSFTIPAAAITAVTGQEANNCAVEIKFERKRPGVADPAYGHGGAAIGIQERKVTSNSTP